MSPTTRWILLAVLALPAALGATGITITVDQGRYSVGGTINATFICACDYPCGTADRVDDVFLRRKSWGREQMGLWYSLGNLRQRNGGAAPTRVTLPLTIPAGVAEASDYVITLWGGDDRCSGESTAFAIGELRLRVLPELHALPAIRVTQPGGSPAVPIIFGAIVPITWDVREEDRSRQVAIELIDGRGGLVCSIARGVPNNGRFMFWKVNYDWLGGSRYTRRSADQQYFGSGFKVRVKREDNPATIFGESNSFAVPRPTVSILCPHQETSGYTYYRGGRVHISWTSRHLAPDQMLGLWVISIPRRDSVWTRYGCRAGELRLAFVRADESSFTWTVGEIPSGGSGIIPGPPCDDFDCKLQIEVLATGEKFMSSNHFTLSHLR